MYKTKFDVYHRYTRGHKKLVTPVSRLSRVGNSFDGLGIRFYNKILQSILDQSTERFKLNIRDMLVRKAYYKIEDYLNDKKTWIRKSFQLHTRLRFNNVKLKMFKRLIRLKF